MAIEQSIFSCVLKRRDTQTTGFGYFSYTDGYEALMNRSMEIKRAAESYASPRNNDLWRVYDVEDKAERSRLEAEKIAAHHPVTFSYQPVNVDGVQKAVFSYGKNLGTDFDGIRPGNVLINMLAADLEDITDYPFRYYDAPELFVPYDTEYFYQNGQTVPPLLPHPAGLTAQDSITDEDVLRFINAEDRLEILYVMFQILLDYHDPEQPTQQILLCDRKENIILWIAALSLLLPKEIARQFSFTTYSFLGTQPDSIDPVYEDLMLCGVYTPEVNGEPAEDMITNYRLSYEIARGKAAIFDFGSDDGYGGHGYCTPGGLRSSQFEFLIDSAFSSDLSLLREYHRFLMEHTSYRRLDNDYLRGFSFFQLCRYPEADNLSCLAEAQQFASRYADPRSMRWIMEQLLCVTVDQGELGIDSTLTEFAASTYQDDPIETRSQICTRFLRCLQQQLAAEIPGDAYCAQRDEICQLCNALQIPFEKQYSTLFLDETIRQIAETTQQTWVLLELSGIVQARLEQQGLSPELLYQESGTPQLFRSVIAKLLAISTEHGRLLEYYIDVMPTPECKAALLDALYPALSGTAQQALTDAAAEQACTEDGTAFLKALAGKALAQPVISQLIREVNPGDGQDRFQEAANLFAMLFSVDSFYQDAYKTTALNCLLDQRLLSGNPYTDMDNSYKTFVFARTFDPENTALFSELTSGYQEAIFSLPNWYDLDSTHYEQFCSLMRLAPDKSARVRDLALIMRINNLLESRSGTDFLKTNKLSIDFSVLNPSERTVFVDRVSAYLCQCSIMEGTVFLPYQKLVPPPERKLASAPHTKVLCAWLTKLLENAPKKQLLQLAAELVVLLHLFSNEQYEEWLKMLRQHAVKCNDLLAYYDDPQLAERIASAFSVSDAVGELNMLRAKLHEASDSNRRSSPMNKLKETTSKLKSFNPFKKPKDE